jgi:REP element-mobilizing transposase RayT
VTSGEAFGVLDRMLDEVDGGSPAYLRDPAVAEMVVEAIFYGALVITHYDLHAFVVMPNHVHVLLTPLVPLPKLTKSLKGITARRANVMLGRTGLPFWQEESYDHLVRGAVEFERIRGYIEDNPVQAGIVEDARGYRWSSRNWATWGSPADVGVRPT